MSIRTIAKPLPGERVVALSPQNATEAASAWLRRPNLFPGRALTAASLAQRQQWQAGHIAQRGQDWIAGVVDGLQVTASGVEGGTGFGATRLRVDKGRALTLSGEDVVLNRPMECLLADVPVVAPPAFFVDGSAVSDPTPDGSLRPRAIGATPGTLVAAAQTTLPAIGILVLQPVMLDTSSFDPMDPCDRSACDEGSVDDVTAFEDWRIGDAVRLLWYVWPSEWRSMQAPEAQLRNALAWTIFQAEAQLTSDDSLPWEPWGAALAMVHLNAARAPLWLDRASVARQGGRARDARLQLAGSGALAANSRLPSLWQSQIEQFAEQVAAAGDPSPPAAQLAQAFGRFLPPVGLLPKNALDAVTHRSNFFPLDFDVDAAPVPVEQLDLAVRASASLAPLNVASAQSVRVLVPVPLQSWEPRLLITEVIDSEFQRTLDRFRLNRARALGARQGLRVRQAVIERALSGKMPDVLPWNEDEAALEAETLGPWGPPPSGGGHRSALRANVHQHYFERATETFTVVGDRLFCWVYLDPEHPPRTLMLQWHTTGSWEHRAYWGENLINWGTNGTPSRARIGDLPTLGAWVFLELPAASVGLAPGAVLDGMAFTLFDGQAAFGRTGSASGSAQTVWLCNVLPAGAQRFGDEPWEMLCVNDLWAPFEATAGVLPLNATTLPATLGGHHDGGALGMHQHLFEGVGAPFAVNTGEWLFCWVYLDPNNPPRELMLQWHAAGVWDHRAFWGFDLIAWGALNTASRQRQGALPQPGQWVRLEVKAQTVGVENTALTGVAFTLFDGHAVFGAAGAGTRGPNNPDGSLGPLTERVWFSGGLPANAQARGMWYFLQPHEMRAPTPASTNGSVQALADLYTSPSLQVLSAQERSQVFQLGVEGFARYLTARADRADDIVDYGFVKVQTDVYRVRQLMLGATAATRLAISPSLASIAQAETAIASQTQIASFLSDLKIGAAPAPKEGPTELAPAPRAARAAATPTVTLSRSTAPAPRGSVSLSSASFVAVAAPPRPALSVSAFAPAAFAPVALAPAAFTAAAPLRVQVSPTKFVAMETEISPIPLRVAAAPPTPIDVRNADPLIGQSFVRTTTLAQRLKEPKSREARDYSTSSRYEAVSALVRLVDALTAEDGGLVPGLFDGIDMHGLEGDGFLEDIPPLPDGKKVVSRPFADFLAHRDLLPKLMKVPARLPPGQTTGDPDEAAMFSDTTDLSDHVVALMRKVEGRIKLYRDAIAACQQTLNSVRTGAATVRTRLVVVADDLAEARHDVSVARALLAEETQRIADVNARRTRVLAEDVKFLAFIRPRETLNLLATHTHAVDPGLIDPPVPACLREHPDVPDELVDMLRVIREAPANWFVSAPPILQRLDRVDHLVRTLQTAQLRANAGIAMPAFSLATSLAAALPGGVAASRLGAAAAQVAVRQSAALAPRLDAIRALDIASIASITWQGLRVQAEQVVSFADLAEGGHGRPDVARAAAVELENIRSIVACLHAEFSAVPAVLRLEWAETLSEFDAAPNLRNLANLPRWSEIGSIDRRQMQAYVDWLFGQIEPNQPQAVALVNDVVRMCLLLASHAPVDRIVSGRLARPVTGVSPGIRIPLTVLEPAKLRVGMQALMYRGESVVARAVVEDVGHLEVSAHVIHTAAAKVDLGDDVRVHFDNAAMVSVSAMSAKRTLFGR